MLGPRVWPRLGVGVNGTLPGAGGPRTVPCLRTASQLGKNTHQGLIMPIFIMVYTCIFNVLPDGVVSTTTSAGRALPGPGGGEGVTASPVGSHLGRSHPKTKG